jgi:hypothetical protein
MGPAGDKYPYRLTDFATNYSQRNMDLFLCHKSLDYRTP